MAAGRKRALLAGGIALIVISVALEGLVPDPHFSDPTWTIHPYHQVPGWNAVIGLLGTAVLVWVSKGLGKAWLQKREGFYDE